MIQREQMRQMLAEGLREPFLEQLDAWLGHWREAFGHPEGQAKLQAWMQKNPDRAAQAQAIFGRLAGYTEKLEIKHDRYAALDSLSDAELEAETCRRLGLTPDQLRAASAKPVLDGTPRTSPPPPALPKAPAVITEEGEWASGGPAT